MTQHKTQQRPRPPRRSAQAPRPPRRSVQPPHKPGRSIVNPRRTPWALIMSVAAVIVVAGGVTAIVMARSGNHAASSGEVAPASLTGVATVEKAATRVPDTSGIAGVLAWDTTGWPGNGSSHVGALQHDHVTTAVTYAVVPPVGGPHSAVWMNAGVYTRPVPSERAIHNLEHGAVWITYNPNLAAAQVAQLTAFVIRQTSLAGPPASNGGKTSSNRFIDLSPWVTDTLPSPIVISAWGHQLRLTSPTDPRLAQFVDTFRHSRTYSPEYGESVDGIAVSTGGRPSTG